MTQDAIVPSTIAAAARAACPASSSAGIARVWSLLGARLKTLSEAGTHRYPEDVRRRLKILNMMAYLIAITTLIFAIQLSAAGFAKNAPVIYINIGLIVMALLVPLAHRVNEVAGGLLIVLAEWIALFSLTAYFGRDGGTPLHYIIGAAAPFVVFGLKRLWLVFAVVLSGILLHIAAWFAFPPGEALLALGRDELDPLYIQAAVTTFALIAASVWYAFNLAETAKAETDALLRNILPGNVVERLKSEPTRAIADTFDEASIVFADISGFVALARRLGPARTVELLSRIVSEFDSLAAKHGVEKIKTIGDAYMVAAGVPEPTPDHANRLARMAIDMLDVVARLRREEHLDLSIRIGLAAGPVMAGVIGTKKFSYDVWGDAVNMAARLENLGRIGRVHVCPVSRNLLTPEFELESCGVLEIKGVGPQETWLIKGSATRH